MAGTKATVVIRQCLQKLYTFLRHHWYVKALVVWVVWLLSGTLVYAYIEELGLFKGFYMAVNVGYSIGWGWPLEQHQPVLWYSVFHLLVGASAVAAALGYFARNMIAVSRDWHVQALKVEQIQVTKRWHEVLWCWIQVNITPLRIIALWLWWITMMVAFSCSTVEWDFIEGLYFALSSLSTGGLWPIPNDSPDWHFGIVGLFSATGIPLMGAAMSSMASMLIQVGDPQETNRIINAKVTEEELNMMQKFGVDDGDGEITRAEYVLLSAMRLGAMTPDLIRAINVRFDKLDVDGSGSLSYDELLEHPERLHVVTLSNGRKSYVAQSNDEVLRELQRRVALAKDCSPSAVMPFDDEEAVNKADADDHPSINSSSSDSSSGSETSDSSGEDGAKERTPAMSVDESAAQKKRDASDPHTPGDPESDERWQRRHSSACLTSSQLTSKGSEELRIVELV